MRILHLVHQYPPDHIGGVEFYTQTLATRQAKDGHSVAVFCPAPRRPAATDLRPVLDHGVRVYRVPVGASGRLAVFMASWRHQRVERALEIVLSAERPDLVHIQHLMGLPFSLIDRIVAAAIPYTITLHDYWFPCANAQLITNDSGRVCPGPAPNWHNCGRCALARAGRGGQFGLAPLVAPLMANRNRRVRRIFERATRIIAPTRFVQQIYQETGFDNQRVKVVPHGLDFPASEVEMIRQGRPSSPPENSLHIGYLGSVGHQKGVHNLVAAVNQLPHAGVRLTIYGALTTFPDYVERLRQQARHPGIELAGPVSREKLWQALGALDVLVMPTLWYEVSPLVIQEAFAVGLPIIGSRIGALEEKITDNVDGILIPPGDVQALADTLLQLYQQPAQLARLRAGIRPVFTMKEHLAAINSIYAQIQAEK